MNTQVDLYIHEVKPLMKQIMNRFENELIKQGFDLPQINLKQPLEAIYRLEKDPSNGKNCLVGDWRDDKGIKNGSLQFNSDGYFFVEQDIVKTHPKKSGWFVEAINAWGKQDSIKCEARLIANPE